MKKKLNKVIVTHPMIGLCYMQVCAEKSATDEEILRVCNAENPSGTRAGWSKVIRKIKKGDPSAIKRNLPVQCEEYPDRMHFLVVC